MIKIQSLILLILLTFFQQNLQAQDSDGDGILDVDELRCDQSSVANSNSGTGTFQDQLYIFNWDGADFDDGLQTGDTQTFNLPDGLIVTALFTNVTLSGVGAEVTTSDFKTWSGALLDNLYNTPGVEESFYANVETSKMEITVSFSATKNGLSFPLHLLALDSETTSSSSIENWSVTTNGTNWQFLEQYAGGGVWTGVATPTVTTTDTEQSGGNTIYYSEGATELSYDINSDTSIRRQGFALGLYLVCDTDNDGTPDILDICDGFDDKKDMDTDGVPDGCDQDNDNDGILDSGELRCDYPTVANSNMGTGVYQDQLYFFNWDGADFNDGLQTGDSQTFNFPDGLSITALFTNVALTGSGAELITSDLETWPGALLHNLYNTPGTQESFYGNVETATMSITVSFSAVKNGQPFPLDLLALDPETTNTSTQEDWSVTTNGTNWSLLEQYSGGGVWTGAGTPTVTATDTEQSGGNSIFYSKGVTELNYNITSDGAVRRQAFAVGLYLICDTDNDGTPDAQDLDSDNDGIYDVVEAGGTDTDNDGIADGTFGTNGIPSSAGTGLTPIETTSGIADYLNLDSDDDGCSDSNEAYDSSTADGGDGGQFGTGTPTAINADGTVTAATYTTGSVAAVTDDSDITACLVIDSDNDGVPDTSDLDDDNDGIPDTVEGTIDTDGDGVPDYLDLDSDNDGIADIKEAGGIDTDGDGQIDYPISDDPMSMNDTNNDGLDDGIATSPLPDLDSDLDGLVNRLDLDSDNDGITDIIEAGGLDINTDGQVDYATPGDPTTMLDVDSDGFINTIDTNNNTIVGTNDGGTTLPDSDTDGDGYPNRLDLDSDNDGIHDVIESGGIDDDNNGTANDNDNNVDNNASNGIPTSAPGGNTPIDTGANASPDYLNLDSDEDGCSDANEAYGNADTDGGDGGQFGTGTPAATVAFGLVTEAVYNTGAVEAVVVSTDTTACEILDADADGDGVLDDQEVLDGTDPNNPCDFVIASVTETQTGSYLVADCDGDGVTNEQEITDNTNPEDPCNYNRANVTLNQSGDYLISDCDGDGVLNGTEILDGTEVDNPCNFLATSSTIEKSGDYLDADCDGDLISNGQEITDGTNPEDPCNNIGGTIPSGAICDIDIESDLMLPRNNGGVFKITNIEAFPDNTVRIYNRWGILVFETKGYDNGNNGFQGVSQGRATIQKNERLPVGTYFYIIDYRKGQENKSKTGYLYLNR